MKLVALNKMICSFAPKMSAHELSDETHSPMDIITKRTLHFITLFYILE
jgi:hypothetical protein